MKKQINGGYTIVELIITSLILLIMAGIAFDFGRNLIRAQRLNYTYNRIVDMIQQTRNLALTQNSVNSNLNYTIVFDLRNSNIDIKKSLANGGSEEIDNFNLNSDDMAVSASLDTNLPSSCDLLSIEYSATNKNYAKYSCTDNNGSTHNDFHQIKFRIQDNKTNKARAFLIHKGSGTPQISSP